MKNEKNIYEEKLKEAWKTKQKTEKQWKRGGKGVSLARYIEANSLKNNPKSNSKRDKTSYMKDIRTFVFCKESGYNSKNLCRGRPLRKRN